MSKDEKVNDVEKNSNVLKYYIFFSAIFIYLIYSYSFLYDFFVNPYHNLIKHKYINHNFNNLKYSLITMFFFNGIFIAYLFTRFNKQKLINYMIIAVWLSLFFIYTSSYHYSHLFDLSNIPFINSVVFFLTVYIYVIFTSAYGVFNFTFFILWIVSFLLFFKKQSFKKHRKQDIVVLLIFSTLSFAIFPLIFQSLWAYIF